MSSRILIVEDDPLVAESVEYALVRDGMRADIAADATSALARAASTDYDVVVLDVGLPGGMSGLDVCTTLRATSAVPIIMLTARGSELDRVLGLDRGADDYLVKPFSMPELVARIRAQIRRRRLEAAEGGRQLRRVGPLEIDLGRYEVHVDGRPVHLTPSEFKLLSILSERPGRVVTRRQIVEVLWSSEYVGDMRVCDAHVARLRRKLDAARPGGSRLVSAVRGAGYKLEVE